MNTTSKSQNQSQSGRLQSQQSQQQAGGRFQSGPEAQGVSIGSQHSFGESEFAQDGNIQGNYIDRSDDLRGGVVSQSEPVGSAQGPRSMTRSLSSTPQSGGSLNEDISSGSDDVLSNDDEAQRR